LLFNTDFGSAGYTASYDETTDTLPLDQATPGTDLMWFADSDAGLDLIGDNVPVPAPEPSALLVFGSALLAVDLLRQVSAT